MYLSGEVKIDKKVLEELSSRQKEDVEALAIAIENGTYEKEKPLPKATNGGDPVEPIDTDGIGSWRPGVFGGFSEPDKPVVQQPVPQPSAAHSLETTVGEMTSGFYSELRELTKNSGNGALKTALRCCISLLEEFYSRV